MRHPRLRNLRRFETPTYWGWRVTLDRAGIRYERYFADGADSARAFQRALRWRNQMVRRLPPPVCLHRRDVTNTTGVVGVTRTVEKTRRGRRFVRWTAHWCDVPGRQRSRSFSVDKYGEQKARQLAIEARQEAVAEILRRRPKGPFPPRRMRKRRSRFIGATG